MLMKNQVLVCAFLALAACVQPPPPPISPQLQKVYDACAAGNATACQTIREVEASRAQQAATSVLVPAPVYQPVYLDPEPFMRRNTTVTTTCRPTGYGLGATVTCTSR